jgi:hypothetical protein
MNDVIRERFAGFAELYSSEGMLGLGEAFVKVASELEAASAAKAMLESEKEFLRVRLAEKMSEENVPRFSIGDKRIRSSEELFVSAAGEVAPAMIHVLQDSGNGALVKETVAPGTLKKFISDLRGKSEGGMPDPVLVSLMEAGVSIKVVDMARFY